MPMAPHPSLQHVGPQHTVLQAQQEVTRYKARFKPTLQKKFDLLLAFICFPRFTICKLLKYLMGIFSLQTGNLGPEVIQMPLEVLVRLE